MSYQDVTVKLIGGPEKLQGRMERMRYEGRTLRFPYIKSPPKGAWLSESLSDPLASVEFETVRYEIDYKDPRYDFVTQGQSRYYPAYFVDEEKRDLKRKFDGLERSATELDRQLHDERRYRKEDEESLRVERARCQGVEAELDKAGDALREVSRLRGELAEATGELRNERTLRREGDVEIMKLQDRNRLAVKVLTGQPIP